MVGIIPVKSFGQSVLEGEADILPTSLGDLQGDRKETMDAHGYHPPGNANLLAQRSQFQEGSDKWLDDDEDLGLRRKKGPFSLDGTLRRHPGDVFIDANWQLWGGEILL